MSSGLTPVPSPLPPRIRTGWFNGGVPTRNRLEVQVFHGASRLSPNYRPGWFSGTELAIQKEGKYGGEDRDNSPTETEDMERDPWKREVDGTNTMPPISCFVFGDSAESGWLA